MLLRTWIEKHIIDVDGRLAARRLNKNWFISRGFKERYKCIIQETKFVKPRNLRVSIYCILNQISTLPRCPGCNKVVDFDKYRGKFYKFCSSICSNQNDEKKLTAIKSCQAKYGVNNAFQLKKFQNKFTKTMLKKYGVKNYSHINVSPSSLRRLEDKKYLKKRYVNNQESILTIATDLGVDSTTIRRALKKFNLYKKLRGIYSNAEVEVRNFIKSLGVDGLITNDRKLISPKEIDIFVPKHNLAIEYDGIYWHTKRDRQEHLEKTQRCLIENVQLVHIFENEWNNPIKREVWKSIIRNKTGIGLKILDVNELTVDSVDKDMAQEFLLYNSLIPWSPITQAYGLYHQKELVSMLGVKYLKVALETLKNDWRICSYCCVRNTYIGVAFQKLLDAFIYEEQPGRIFAYSDLRFSVGNVYLNTGFELKSHLPPEGYYYFKNQLLKCNDVKTRKIIQTSLKKYDKGLTTRENLIMNRVPKIFDCGKMFFVLKL